MRPLVACLILPLLFGALSGEEAEGVGTGAENTRVGEADIEREAEIADLDEPLTTESRPIDREHLRKALLHPLSDFFQFPIENNAYLDVANTGEHRYVSNFQPIIPINLGEDWQLINRTVIPFVSEPLAPGGRVEGIGDIVHATWLSPDWDREFVWGVGPIFQFPTHTDDFTGIDAWGAGPSVIGLFSKGPWIGGGLAGQLWDFAGDDDLNRLLLQPYLSYRFPTGTYLLTAPAITADWEAQTDDRWLIPVGAGVGQMLPLGDGIFAAHFAYYYNVERPFHMGRHQLQLNLQILLPK